MICSYNKFYIGKTSEAFKIRYNKHVSEIKCRKSFSKINFANHALANIIIILMEKDLVISQKICVSIQYWKNLLLNIMVFFYNILNIHIF